jgi:LCP family protein required for cell wall assembly
LALALVLAACAPSAKPADVVVAPTTTSTSTTTTTTTPTTTTLPPAPTVQIAGDMGGGLRATAEAFFDYLHDPTRPAPNGMTPEFAAHVAGYAAPEGDVDATARAEELGNGDRVAIVQVGNDTILFVNAGEGWRVVGAFLSDRDPWLGPTSPRNLLVLGSDARVGENQLGLRADSVHILSILPSSGEGAFLGFPRDSWVRGSKLTNLMPRGGPDLMVEVIEEVSGIEMEGWVAVGFEGFLDLMKELGPLEIDLPTVMRSGNNWADYPAGPQVLDPKLTLRLARIRKGLPRGDFDRTYNQGLITHAAMVMIQDMGIELLPRWVAVFDQHGFTDLDTEALFTFLATAYVATPESLTNAVVPAFNGRVGEAAVVFIADSAEAVFRDLDDGVLDETGS